MAPSKTKKAAAAAAKKNLKIGTRRSSRKKADPDVNILEPELEDPGGGYPAELEGGGGGVTTPASHGAGPAAESTQLAAVSDGRASERPRGMDDLESEITAIKGQSAISQLGLADLYWRTDSCID